MAVNVFVQLYKIPKGFNVQNTKLFENYPKGQNSIIQNFIPRLQITKLYSELPKTLKFS